MDYYTDDFMSLHPRTIVYNVLSATMQVVAAYVACFI